MAVLGFGVERRGSGAGQSNRNPFLLALSLRLQGLKFGGFWDERPDDRRLLGYLEPKGMCSGPRTNPAFPPTFSIEEEGALPFF